MFGRFEREGITCICPIHSHWTGNGVFLKGGFANDLIETIVGWAYQYITTDESSKNQLAKYDHFLTGFFVETWKKKDGSSLTSIMDKAIAKNKEYFENEENKDRDN